MCEIEKNIFILSNIYFQKHLKKIVKMQFLKTVKNAQCAIIFG